MRAGPSVVRFWKWAVAVVRNRSTPHMMLLYNLQPHVLDIALHVDSLHSASSKATQFVTAGHEVCVLQGRPSRRHARRQDNPFEQRYVQQRDFFRGRNHHHHTKCRGGYPYFAYKRKSSAVALRCFVRSLLRVQICCLISN